MWVHVPKYMYMHTRVQRPEEGVGGCESLNVIPGNQIMGLCQSYKYS